MNLQQKRIKIAEACAWTNIHFNGIRGEWSGVPPERDRDSEPVPDYLNDLNAMHEAEKVLTPEQQKTYALQWLPCVLRINGRGVRPRAEEFKLAHATAAQRAEAFGLTLNLWKA